MNEKQPRPHSGDRSEHEASRERHDQETSHERQPDRHPRVWIGSLADYNNGTLHGNWVDAAVGEEDLIAAAQAILRSSETPGAEEYAIFDYEDFGDFKVGEYEQLSLIARVARGIQEHGDAFAAWAELHDGDPDMLDAFEDSYLGEYDSPTDWAREVIEETDIQRRLTEAFGEELARYIHFDADAFARDAFLEGSISVCHKDGGGCWMFRTDP